MNAYEKWTQEMLAEDRPSRVWGPATVSRVLPELGNLVAVPQRNERAYDHTMKVLDGPGTKNPVTLWAKLLHDTGKALGVRGHEITSELIARRRLPLLGAPDEVTEVVARIVRTHMVDLTGYKHDQSIRNWIAWVGIENIPNWFVLRRDDSLAYGRNKRALEIIDRFETRVNALIPKKKLLTFIDLPITAKDIRFVTGLRDEAALFAVMCDLVEAANTMTCGTDRESLLLAAQCFGRMTQ